MTMHDPQARMSLSENRREQFRRLLKYTGLAILALIVFVLIAPNQLRSALLTLNLSFLALLFTLRTVYIFAPLRHQQRFPLLCKKTSDTYQALTVEQKLYVNWILLALFVAFVYTTGGSALSPPFAAVLLLFSGFIALRDGLRWYRALYENPLGKAAIAIGFAIASNLAYALANQLVSQVVNATPTNFLRTTLFIAILMIPVLMTLAGGIALAIGSAASSLIILLSAGPSLDKFRQWLFAGTWPVQTIRFAFATRFIQLLFYLGIFSTLSLLGGRHFNWYEKKVSGWIPGLIFNLDMYVSNECKLGSGFKLAPLGDAKFLIAQQSNSGINFQLPAKCDDLPPPKALPTASGVP